MGIKCKLVGECETAKAKSAGHTLCDSNVPYLSNAIMSPFLLFVSFKISRIVSIDERSVIMKNISNINVHIEILITTK